MKNKFLLFAVILFAACSKTEVQSPLSSSNVSQLKVPDQVPQGKMIVTWKNPKGTYPNEKQIEYIAYRNKVNEVLDGIKYFSYLRDPETAPEGSVTQKTTYSHDFRIGYIKQDSTIVWKNTGGDSKKILIGENRYGKIYQNKSYRWLIDNKENSSSYNSNYILTPVGNNVRERTGSGDGSDIVDGVVSNWAFKIIAPHTLYEGFDYPETGQSRYNIDGERCVLDYGEYDGKSDNIVTYNGEIMYLPLDQPGGWGEE